MNTGSAVIINEYMNGRGAVIPDDDLEYPAWIEIRNQGGITEIVALQLALDSKYRPADSDDSQGRFLIRSAQFMDPVIYPPGTLITVVGRLQGAESRLIGEMDYQYPVIDVVELQKYEPQQKTKPQVHIGIGVGKTF